MLALVLTSDPVSLVLVRNATCDVSYLVALLSTAVDYIPSSISDIKLHSSIITSHIDTEFLIIVVIIVSSEIGPTGQANTYSLKCCVECLECLLIFCFLNGKTSGTILVKC